MPDETDYPIDFFSPRWISRYVAQSIQICGDLSLAYDLLLRDASPEFKRRIKRQVRLK
jgi:hypothetical protein